MNHHHLAVSTTTVPSPETNLADSTYPAANKLLRTIPQIRWPSSSTSPITIRTPLFEFAKSRFNQICKIAFESSHLAFDSNL
ncbi:hypothetical protein Hanom_Chr11g01008961 [Helianthus anomalus]